MAKGKSRPADVSYGPDKDWMAENDLRTLVEAEKIKMDPSRLKAAMACKRKQMKAMQKAGS